MEHSADNPQALSSRDISYFLLCSIWTHYDYGGISMRRSLRSALLEDSLSLLRMSNPDREGNTPLGSQYTLLAEARKRKADPAQGLLFGAKHSQSYDLAMLLLEKLLDVCKKNDKDFKGEDTTLLEEVMRLTPPPFCQETNSIDVIQTEARDRIYDKLKEE